MPSETASFVIPEDVAKMLDRLAEVDRLNRSAAVRLCIAHEFERRFGANGGNKPVDADSPAPAPEASEAGR